MSACTAVVPRHSSRQFPPLSPPPDASSSTATASPSDFASLFCAPFSFNSWTRIKASKKLTDLDAEVVLKAINDPENAPGIRTVFQMLSRIDITALFQKILDLENTDRRQEAHSARSKLQTFAYSSRFPRMTVDPKILINNPSLQAFIPSLDPKALNETIPALPESFVAHEVISEESIALAQSLLQLEENGIYTLDASNYSEWIQIRKQLAAHLDKIPTTSIAYMAQQNLEQLIPFLSSMRWRHLAIIIPTIPAAQFVDMAYRLLETAQTEIKNCKESDEDQRVIHPGSKKQQGTCHDQIKVLEHATLEQKQLFCDTLTPENIEKLESWGITREWLQQSFYSNETTLELMRAFNKKWRGKQPIF